MKIDFFLSDCTEPARTDKLFGICDDADDNKAYTTIEQSEKWNAVVQNESGIGVTFTAIDHCVLVYKEGNKEKESTCDGMLTFGESLYLIELKDQRTAGWISKALDQLENTIRLLLQNQQIERFKYKKALACNRSKKYPRFNTILNAENKRFFQTYGFRIDIQAEIVIK